MRRRLFSFPKFLISLAALSICSIRTSAMTLPKSRVELFFQSPKDLKDRVRFLQSWGVTAFNLVNKHRSDPVLDWVDTIQNECPDADICAHYSLKYNKVPRKGPEQHAELLQNFLEESKANEMLLVSGSGKSNVWNTLQALEYIPDNHPGQVAVAYNPYFPEPKDQAMENERLAKKLATGKVTKVYLQFGSDLLKLKTGLEYLERTTKDVKNHKVTLAGSLFLPTAKLIAQQKFRPWNGVFLGPEFLEGPESASAVVVEMMKLYASHSVEFLWEAPGIRTEKDWAVVEELLQEMSSESASTGSSIQDQPMAPDVWADKNSTNIKRQKLAKDSDVQQRSQEPAILLFGSHDVRLRDNRAVEEALRNHQVVIPVFLWTKQCEWGARGALEVVLKDALISLDKSLQRHGLQLVCRDCQDSDGIKDLSQLVDETGAKTVYWNKEHTTESRVLETKRRQTLEKWE